MRKNIILICLGAVLIIIAIVSISYPMNVANTRHSDTSNSNATSTQGSSNPDNTTPKPYGLVTLRIGETVRYPHIAMTLVRITEDSRCPTDVQCIWEGTAKAELTLMSNSGSGTSSIELGKSFTAEKETIRLVSVTPATIAGKAILPSEYQAVFEVLLSTSTSPNTSNQQGACFVGGCSGEICSDQEGIVSNCMYKEEFACYKKTSTCKRQAGGKCGWTETQALAMCLKAVTP